MTFPAVEIPRPDIWDNRTSSHKPLLMPSPYPTVPSPPAAEESFYSREAVTSSQGLVSHSSDIFVCCGWRGGSHCLCSSTIVTKCKKNKLSPDSLVHWNTNTSFSCVCINKWGFLEIFLLRKNFNIFKSREITTMQSHYPVSEMINSWLILFHPYLHLN